MTTPSMPDDPRTPEERALAARLRAEALPGPSPALDARILAAARAAVDDGVRPPGPVVAAPPPRMQGRPAGHARRRRRWPAAAGVSASLVLAVALAWQLRPVPEAQDAVASSGQYAAVQAAEEATQHVMVPPSPPPPPPPPPVRESSVQMDQAKRPPGTAARARGAAPTARDQAVPAKASAPAPTTATPPAQAAPTAAPVVVEPQPVPYRALSGAPPDRAGGYLSPAELEAADRERAEETRRDRFEAGANRALQQAPPAPAAALHDTPLDDAPPASADAPAVRAAWLARIRELVKAGDFDAARTSLAEFRKRHPDATLPDDLRALAP